MIKEINEQIGYTTVALYLLFDTQAKNKADGYPEWNPEDKEQYPLHPRKHTKEGELDWKINREHKLYCRWRDQQRRALTPHSDSSLGYFFKKIHGDWFEWAWTGRYADTGSEEELGFLHYVAALDATGRRKTEERTIDRISGEQGYTFANTRWATPKGQRLNQGKHKQHPICHAIRLPTVPRTKHRRKSTNHGVGTKTKRHHAAPGNGYFLARIRHAMTRGSAAKAKPNVQTLLELLKRAGGGEQMTSGIATYMQEGRRQWG